MDDLEPVRASAAEQAVVFAAPAHLDPVVALPRQLRLVHRLRRRACRWSPSSSSPAPTSRPTRSSARCSQRSPGPPGGWLADRVGGARVALASFVGDGAGRAASLLLQRGGGRMAGGVARVPRPVRAAVRRQRRRQRRGVPADPGRVHRRRPAGVRRRARRRDPRRCARARWRAPRRSASPRRSPHSAVSSSPRPTAPPSRSPAARPPRCTRSSSSTSRASPSPGGSTCAAARRSHRDRPPTPRNGFVAAVDSSPSNHGSTP